jgi:EmrB/QacA subfamily drug resistance transporter
VVAEAQKSVPVGRSLAILAVAALAFALAQTAVVPAIGQLAKDLNTSAQNVTWTLTAYLVSAAVLTPVLGRLGDMFGKRRMLVISLLVFAAGGALAALGGNLGQVVTGRVLQGAGGGIFPLCFGIVRDEFPEKRRPGAVGLVSAIAGIGGGLGLLMGGLLVDHASYHWIFWSGAFMALAAAVAAQLWLPESPQLTPGRVDITGTVLLAVGITAPLIAISQGASWGWTSGRTLGLIVGGLLVLVAFVLVERRVAEPLVDMAVMARPTVLVTNLATVLVGFGMFGAFLLVPQLAETPSAAGYGFGVNPTHAGLLMLPGCMTMLVAGPLSGLLAQRYGAKLPLALGGLVTSAGLLLLAFEHSAQSGVLGLTMVAFFGVGLAFAAMPNLIVDSVDVAQTGQATGVNALIRSVGSSLGSTIIASVLATSVTGAGLLPTEHSYKVSFLICAGVALMAAVAAAFVPPSSRHSSVDVLEEIGAAAPLGDAALAADRSS